MSVVISPSGRALRPPPAVIVLASLPQDRSSIARLVRELGYRATESDDPLEVLRRLRAHPASAQLLLVEVSLPQMDGGEVAERARDAAPGIRTVFLSSDPEGTDAALIGAYPEQPVLELPAQHRALVAVVRGALGRSRAGAGPAERRPSRTSGRFGTAGEIADAGRI